MTTPLQPTSLEELREAILSAPRVLAAGAGTKPRLAAADAVRISTTRLTGIVEYEPDEFTFTARAGTPVREIAGTLAQRGQYLPFDPPLAAAGATLGGTVAAGLSGPGRWRYGGVRDFILGVRLVDGAGRPLRVGGKVVKNAAGFDVSKFLVGSLGRFGALAEVSFKVFPRPAARCTLEFTVGDEAAVAARLTDLAAGRWEPDAIDARPLERRVYLRLAAPAAALAEMEREVQARWGGRRLPDEEAERFWSDVGEFRWAHPDGVWLKLVLRPPLVPDLTKLVRGLSGARIHVSVGGHLGLLSLPDLGDWARLEKDLRALGVDTLTLRGDAPLRPTAPPPPAVAAAVKVALDPDHRFPALD